MDSGEHGQTLEVHHNGHHWQKGLLFHSDCKRPHALRSGVLQERRAELLKGEIKHLKGEYKELKDLQKEVAGKDFLGRPRQQVKLDYEESSKREQDMDFAEQNGFSLSLKIRTRYMPLVDNKCKAVIDGYLYDVSYVDKNRVEQWLYLEGVKQLDSD